MIVRVATEGQYRLDDGQSARLNELDNEIVSCVEAGDEEGFRRLFDQMLELARSGTEPIYLSLAENSHQPSCWQIRDYEFLG